MAEATHFRYSAGDEPIAGYLLVERLGQSASGSVWKARGQGKTIALKIVDLKQEIGQKELRALKRVKDINHPNLVPIFAFWLKDSSGRTMDPDELLDQLSDVTSASTPVSRKAIQLIIAMGLGESTLGDHLRGRRKGGEKGIPREELLDYIDSAARAIDHLNLHYGIQHGDVKPTNILLVGGGVQVCDFGLASAVRDDMQQTIAGYSPAYAAPELIADDVATDRSDQYALAVTFVELLTGHLPFPVEVEELYDAKTCGRIALDGLGETDRWIIQRATSLDPSERFETCVEMIKALRTTGSSALDELTGYRPEYEAGDMPVPGYRLVKALGIGGAGQVWKASRAGVDVALKIVNLNRKIGQKELEALRLVKEFKHPNLIPIHGFWLKDDTDTIRDGSQFDLTVPTRPTPPQETSRSAAMDGTVDLATLPADGTVDVSGWTPVSDAGRTNSVGDRGVEARVPRSTQLIIAMGLGDATLADRLTECDDDQLQGIPRKEVLDYLHDAAEAIDLLNEKGIQHCDIKPTNILLVGRGTDVKGGVQVCDFGLAQAVGGERGNSSPAYSPPYAAPEVMSGEGPSAATDQFSLAVTYVELRTNDIPYPCDSLRKLKAAKLAGQIDLTKLARRDRRVIRRACSPDPAKRYRNTRQMVAALQRRSLAVPIAIEILMAIALVASILYPRPNHDGQTLEKIAAHREAHDYPMAWDRTGDLEDDDAQLQSRQQVVNAWQDAILAAAQGQVDQQTESIHDACNQLVGIESDHPRAALVGPQVFVLRARVRARLEQWDEAMLDLQEVADDLDQLEPSDPVRIHYGLLTAVHRCTIDQGRDAEAIGNDKELLSRLTAIHQQRSSLTADCWEPWDEQHFNQLISAIVAHAEQLDESTTAFANLSDVIRQVTGAPADREILLKRVTRLVKGGKADEIQRCETILAGLAARYTDVASRQLIQQYRCLVQLIDPATSWTTALASLEALDAEDIPNRNAGWLLDAMSQRLAREALDNPQAVQYPTLQHHCTLYRARNPNDLTNNACWLEAAIEQRLNGGQQIPDNALSVLSSLTESAANLSDQRREYCQYVRSLVLFHTRDNQEIGNDLIRVAEDDSDPWMTPHRRQRMVEMLLALSSALIGEARSGPTRESDVFLSPPAAAAAEQASRLSATAYRLANASERDDETFRQLLRVRALAAYYDGATRGDAADWQEEVIGVLQEYEKLQGELDGKLNLVRALTHAQGQSEDDVRQALHSFAAVLQTWFNSIEAPVFHASESAPGRSRFDENKPSVVVCRQVIEPALAVAKLPNIPDATRPSEVETPKLPAVTRAVASELASILALKGHLLLTDHDVRRFYESSVTPAEPGQAAHHAYLAYLWANSIVPGNEQHLFGLGMAFHELTEVSQAEKIQGLNWVVQQVDQHHIRSPKVRGLRGFVHALKARDSVSLADKAGFYQQARQDFRQALQTANQLSNQDRLVFEPSYLVSLSSVDLELAFVREKRERQRNRARMLLSEAIRVADRATQLDWASAPELAWISKGNAQEDMALYVRGGENNYVESVKSFGKARSIAFRHWRSTKLATLSRERAQFRWISGDPNEVAIRKITSDLSKAHMGKEALDWEIMFWIGQAYRLLAEQYHHPQDTERARKAFQQASQSARGKSNDWPVYQIGWAEFEMSQKDTQRAAALAGEVIQRGVDNVRDDIFLRAIPIAFQGQPAETVATQIEAYVTNTKQRPFMQAELRLMRAPHWVQAAREDNERARRFLRRALQDCQAVRDWAQRELGTMPESETHFRARADAWIGGVMSNYDFLELLDDDNREAMIKTLRTDLDRAIRDLIKEDRASSAEALRTAGGVWKYFFDEPHAELK